MTDLAAWQEGNGRYLAASIAWLRLRLKKASPIGAPPTSAAATGPRRLFAQRKPPADTPPAPAPRQVSDASIAAAAAAREEAAQIDPPPALLLLATQFGLSDFERDTLLLAAATELDTRMPLLCARVAGDRSNMHASFALALAILDDPSWDALSPQGPLRYWRLVETGDDGVGAPVAGPLRVNERVLHYLKGLSTLDVRLARLLTPVVAPDTPLPPSQTKGAERITERWKIGEGNAPPPVALLLGPDASAKLLVAGSVMAEAGRRLYRLDVEALPAQASELATIARLWQLESALSGAALYVDAQHDTQAPEAKAALDRAITEGSRSGGLFFVAAREPPERMGFDSFAVDVARPTAAEQHAAWCEALTALADDDRAEIADGLAAQFNLNLPTISTIAGDTPAEPLDNLPGRLWDECRNRMRPRVEALAMRIEPRADWDDLVVNDETGQLLREIVAQVRTRSIVYTQWAFAERISRGLGITALFSGESGTGKTFAAEVIASTLRLPLYRIDLSQVVNKYIGETEKNLQRLFDRMEGAGAILFFDEADALFGKRSEVRDSHDRYANIEVNYLLQRMESYSGLAILATNMKGALDPAFTRRLRFIVPFGFPGPAERRALWEKVFPAETPIEALDFERVTRLSLTGASIRNVALNAAFLAADGDGKVTTPLVLRAARAEFRKMDLVVNEAEFSP